MDSKEILQRNNDMISRLECCIVADIVADIVGKGLAGSKDEVEGVK